jgi:endoribonuclease LACTB2
MGGVHKLEETLKHRRMRHEQVKKQMDLGRSALEMVDHIYLGLAPELKSLALLTIESHLRSLNKAR